MAKPKGVTLDGARVQQRLDELGWTQEKLAEKAGVSLGVVSKVVRNKSVSRDSAADIAEALGIDLNALLPAPEGEPAPDEPRLIGGVWRGTGRDVEVPGLLKYKVPPGVVHYEVEMTVTQAGPTFTAKGWLIGQEGERQPFEAAGSVREGGNVVLFGWKNARPELKDYGTALFTLRDDPQNHTVVLEGFFMGRELNHGTPLFLGWMSVSRVSPAAGAG